jgi:hypothetical protein
MSISVVYLEGSEFFFVVFVSRIVMVFLLVLYVQDVAKITVKVNCVISFRDFAKCPDVSKIPDIMLLQPLDLQILNLYRKLSLSGSLQGVHAFYVGYRRHSRILSHTV